MSNVLVVNRHDMPKVEFGSKIVYIGRGTPLGNKYYIGRDGNRKTVIGKYRRWLWIEMKKVDSPAKQMFDKLVGIVKSGNNVYLQCSCAPQPCHGDMIKRAILWELDK